MCPSIPARISSVGLRGLFCLPFGGLCARFYLSGKISYLLRRFDCQHDDLSEENFVSRDGAMRWYLISSKRHPACSFRLFCMYLQVIAATNRPDVLDPALLRSGRLDRKIELPHPSEEARGRILQIHSRKMNVDTGKLQGQHCTHDF